MSEDNLVLTNFRTPKDLHHKLKQISVRENRPIGDILTKLVEEYVKIHGEGNPIHPLDLWQEKDFKACPAFLTGLEKWGSYIQNCTEDERKEVYERASALKRHIEKRFSV